MYVCICVYMPVPRTGCCAPRDWAESEFLLFSLTLNSKLHFCSCFLMPLTLSPCKVAAISQLSPRHGSFYEKLLMSSPGTVLSSVVCQTYLGAFWEIPNPDPVFRLLLPRHRMQMMAGFLYLPANSRPPGQPYS